MKTLKNRGRVRRRHSKASYQPLFIYFGDAPSDGRTHRLSPPFLLPSSAIAGGAFIFALRTLFLLYALYGRLYGRRVKSFPPDALRRIKSFLVCYIKNSIRLALATLKTLFALLYSIYKRELQAPSKAI